MKLLLASAIVGIALAEHAGILEVERPLSGRGVKKPELLTRWFVGHKKGKAHREALKEKIAALGGHLHHEFSVVDAIAVEMDAHLAKQLEDHAAVRYVEEDSIVVPMAETTPWGVEAVNAPEVWNDDTVPTQGDGAIVCVIDGGLYWQHEDFSGLNIVNQNDASEWEFDGCNHGTHVSGTIGATMGNGLGVTSVAPAAAQYIVRVFSFEACDYSYESSVIAAAEECIEGGANIISMSLGGSGSSTTTADAWEDIYENQNVLPIAAAGNDGNADYSYPASYATVMSVAALDEDLDIASFSQYNDQVDIAGPGVDVVSTIAASSLETFTVFADGNAYQFEADQVQNTTWGNVTGNILNMAAGCASGDFNGIDATGKIVYCRLDTMTTSGLKDAEDAGAAAIVFSSTGYSGTGNWRLSKRFDIPGGSISESDGDIIEGLTSPWGNLELFETLSSYVSGYESLQGTSMATPHVSAVAALLWAANPGAGAHLIRQCMEDTALDLGDSGRDDYFGHGLVQADAAHNCVVGDGTAYPTPSPTTLAPTTADSVPTMSPTPSPLPVYHEVCVETVGPIDSETVGHESQTASFTVEQAMADSIEAMTEMHFFVSTRINHTYMSDLTATLNHNDASVVVLDEECGSRDDLSVIISNDAVDEVTDHCLDSDHSYSKWYEVMPANDMSSLWESGIAGQWNITFTDGYTGDTGVIGITCIGWRNENDDDQDGNNDDAGANELLGSVALIAGMLGLLMN